MKLSLERMAGLRKFLLRTESRSNQVRRSSFSNRSDPGFVPNRYPPRFFLRTQAKTKRQTKKVDWLGAFLLFSGLLSFYCVLFPQSAGLWGRNVVKFLGWFAGLGRYFLPVYV